MSLQVSTLPQSKFLDFTNLQRSSISGERFFYATKGKGFLAEISRTLTVMHCETTNKVQHDLFLLLEVFLGEIHKVVPDKVVVQILRRYAFVPIQKTIQSAMVAVHGLNMINAFENSLQNSLSLWAC